jgi:hypothetical protein
MDYGDNQGVHFQEIKSWAELQDKIGFPMYYLACFQMILIFFHYLTTLDRIHKWYRINISVPG